MIRRVTAISKVKHLRCEAEAKASVNSATELVVVDPKASDLTMARVKWV